MASLLLFGVVRRTLESEKLRARYGRATPWLAGGVAAIWMVHPLQTASVTYIIQRDESLMGLLFLLTIYCGVRACGSPYPHRWGLSAIIACALGTRLKPDHVGAHEHLGTVLAKQGRSKEALAHYSEALRLRPNSAEAHNGLGSALAGQGNLEGAIARYAEALRLNPNYGEAENNLGAALYRQGKVTEAMAHFARAIQLDPRNAVAHNNLGAALGGQGKLEEATRYFAEAVRLRPDFTEARDNLRKAQASRH